MAVLLDAYALIAMLGGTEAERDVRLLLDRGDAAITTVNLTEVLDITGRVRGVPEAELDRVLTPLLGGALAIIPFDLRQARAAAAIRVAHYHRTRCPISLADCVLLGSCEPGDAVATADSHVLNVAETIELQPIALPGGS